MSQTIKQNTFTSWSNEWVYALMIDRFHDGNSRMVPSDHFRRGFGSYKDLRETCGGNFKGIIQKLDYISKLGCTSILLSPFQENNPQFYHGYAIQDFLSVDERFGTLEELKILVAEAHARDLKVIMDVVLNHTGNNWSYKETHTPYRKRKPYQFSHWHFPDKPNPLVLRNENWYSRHGHINRWDAYPESWDGDVFELKDLVWNKSSIGYKVMQCMVDIYSYWMKELDVDGFRLDALKHIRPFMANEFCRRIRKKAEALGKESFLLIGEVVGGESLIARYQEVDAYFNFPFYFDFLSRRDEGRYYDSLFSNSLKGMLPVYFLDNHDQIGLEPKKRISDLLPDEAIWGALLLMGVQEGICCLYYGTEQGLHTEGTHDHDVRECLFDPAGTAELFNDQHPHFQKTAESILWAKKLRRESSDIQYKPIGDQLWIIDFYDVTGKSKYKVVANRTSERLAADEYIIGDLLYSNFNTGDTVTELNPCEVRIYKMKND